MSTLTVSRLKLRGSPVNGDSPVPSLGATAFLQNKIEHDLPEDDPVFMGYGAIDNIYPYTQQNRYSRKLTELEVAAAVLENSRLKAVFLPEYGGRLWQLRDKASGRDLLYTNDILRPSNLAVRNAWFSGGIEWNCGVIGHTPFTCAPMFTATYEVNGMPVLRFYQWERIRGVTYQLDICLPGDSRFLHVRVRICNPNKETVPMYWWSNTAVPERKDARVAVPAEQTYTQNNRVLVKKPFPLIDGIDVSYPMNTTLQMDYFYCLQEQRRRYQGYICPDGSGLIEASTSRLRGRKLFVWGQLPGSETWQRFLTEDAGNYVEIQAGIAPTQYGCVPMQPGAAWEFAQVYGAINIDKSAQCADYPVFCAAVESALDKELPAEQLEAWLNETADSMGRAYVPATSHAGSDAALENALRKHTGRDTLNPALDFGKIGESCFDFEHLLEHGKMPTHEESYIPRTFVSGQHWLEILEKAANGFDSGNWLTWYHFGLTLLGETGAAAPHTRKLYEASALFALQSAADICPCAPVFYALAFACKRCGKSDESAAYAKKSCRMLGGDLSVAKDTLQLLVALEKPDPALALYDDLPDAVKADERIQFLHAWALTLSNRYDEALAILLQPGFIMPDFRECEDDLNKLWEELKQRSGRSGISIPKHQNFNAMSIGIRD